MNLINFRDPFDSIFPSWVNYDKFDQFDGVGQVELGNASEGLMELTVTWEYDNWRMVDFQEGFQDKIKEFLQQLISCFFCCLFKSIIYNTFIVRYTRFVR